jgi:hypothetical protein
MNVRVTLLGLLALSLLVVASPKEADAQFVDVEWGYKNQVNGYCACGGYMTEQPTLNANQVSRNMYYRKAGTLPWTRVSVGYTDVGNNEVAWQNAAPFGGAH